MSEVGESSLQASFPIRGWFAESPADFRRDFLAVARPKSYAAGSVIFQAGEVGQDVFGVYSGVVTLQNRLTHPDGVLLHLVWPGEWFGTWSIVLGKGRRMSAIARTAVDLLRIPGDDLRALFRRRPQWHAELARHAVYGTDVAMQIAADLLIHNASARCAAVLLRLGGRRWASGTDAELPVEIPASQNELAMLCNVSRNTYRRVLKDLSSRGLLTIGYRSLTLNDPARLREIANAG